MQTVDRNLHDYIMIYNSALHHTLWPNITRNLTAWCKITFYLITFYLNWQTFPEDKHEETHIMLIIQLSYKIGTSYSISRKKFKTSCNALKFFHLTKQVSDTRKIQDTRDAWIQHSKHFIFSSIVRFECVDLGIILYTFPR
jgi:hypothetical protein